MTARASRKRAAPGTSPAQNLNNPTDFAAQTAPLPADQYLRWDQGTKGMDSPNFGDASNAFTPNLYASMANQTLPQESSNQLTRRPMSTMMPRSSYGSNTHTAWPDVVEDLSQQNFAWVQTTDEEKLDEEAREAMDAAKKTRKQIPPFVQKLRSFLDESRNTDLIRWSHKGDSFIVLDEEEFARTLIPELFKHANYASFVRQLNMYGFHKQVGLSDNSMRASERKNKSPSEYKNPYFKRGKPNWMWLIQKPKSTQGKGKGGKDKHEEGIEEEDVFDVENPGSTAMGGKDRSAGARGAKPPLLIGQGDSSIAHEELAALHNELRSIRQQHQAIAGVIQKIRRDHDQIFQQAQAFQDLHSRHENSINAILTFLATVYSRSLEGHGGPNIANVFAGSIPHDLPQQGSVVDVGELGDQGLNTAGAHNRRQTRRQPLLLQAPPSQENSSDARITSDASTPQAGDNNLDRQPSFFPQGQNRVSSHSVVEDLPDLDSQPEIGSTPQQQVGNGSSTRPDLGAIPQRDILSLINSTNANDVNARGTGQMDFGEALSHLQNRDGKGPLSPSERNGMLQLMANRGNQGLANGSNSNNALTSPNPPMAPAPNFENWQASDDDIAFLQKSMQDTDSKLTNISNRLSPISPNGGIPGFNEAGTYVPPPPNDSLDFDQIFNSGDYFNDVNNVNPGFADSTADFGPNDDFSFDDPLGGNTSADYGADTQADDGGRVVEAVDSSEATSPANTAEDGNQELDSPPKKRKRT